MEPAIEQIWYTRCPVPTASGIAIHHGWLSEEFARDGIQVSSLRASSDRAVRESHFDHRVENSFRHGGNAPPIWSRSEGQDLVAIGLTWLPQYQRILALPGSGIRRVEDLRGERLAMPRRTGEKIDFWRASAQQGYLQVWRQRASRRTKSRSSTCRSTRRISAMLALRTRAACSMLVKSPAAPERRRMRSFAAKSMRSITTARSAPRSRSSWALLWLSTSDAIRIAGSRSITARPTCYRQRKARARAS